MMVSGAVFADNVVVQHLTDYIALGSHPTEPDRGLRRVAQILVALKECIQDLEHFYKGIPLKSTPPDAPKKVTRSSTAPTKSRGSRPAAPDPSPKVLPCYTGYPIKDPKHQFKYTKRLTPSDSARAVFVATMEPPGGEGRDIVVKFTRRYSEEAHRLLAQHSLAPKLLHYEMIKGTGILFVVMDHIEVTTTEDGALEGESGPKRAGWLREAVKLLHDQGFVFGDLRRPNILIEENGLKLVDFDWCGKFGEARYPATVSRDIEWPEGVNGEERIDYPHDKVWFKRLTGTDL